MADSTQVTAKNSFSAMGDPEPLHITANCLDLEKYPINKDEVVDSRRAFKCLNLPKKFEDPNLFYGYGEEDTRRNPIYRTSNSDYGWYVPSLHTVPHRYFPQKHNFTSHLYRCGMYRNYGLNTAGDKSLI